MKKPNILPGSLFIETNSYKLVMIVNWYYDEGINDIRYMTEILYDIIRSPDGKITHLNIVIPVSCPQLTENDLKSKCISIKDDEVIRYVNSHLDELKSNYLAQDVYDMYCSVQEHGLNKWYNKYSE